MLSAARTQIFPGDDLLLVSLVCKLRAEDGDEVAFDDDDWAARLWSW